MSGSNKNIQFLLVRPTRPGNIGAAARALKNMGFPHLGLVRGADPRHPDAYTMAYGAHDLLESISRHPTLEKALSRSQYVVGTTARVHKGYGKPVPLMRAAPEILRRAGNQRVAILFGPEDSGLSNGEIALCQSLITIPASPSHPSLNLAQAVLVVAYELRKSSARSSPAPRKGAGQGLADTNQRERYYTELREILVRIGFVKGTQGTRILSDLRRIYGRADLSPRELRILRGIARQIRWALDHSKIS